MSFGHFSVKRFGQNFLIDANIIRKILGAAEIKKNEFVLEIGPGSGALTSELASSARRLCMVEIDKKLVSSLKIKYEGVENIDILSGDILKFDLKRYAKREKIKSFKVVANLPYYITTPVIEYLFKNINLINDIYIMVQKELAQRILAHPGTKEYGSFTCFVNYFCKPLILFGVKSGSFRPSPKVDSCFVQLKPYGIKKRVVSVKSESLFFKIVRSSFGQRRKTLLNSLATVVDKDVLVKSVSGDILAKRAEDISLAEFANISNQAFDFLKVR